jgi:hypothetical protein
MSTATRCVFENNVRLDKVTVTIDTEAGRRRKEIDFRIRVKEI